MGTQSAGISIHLILPFLEIFFDVIINITPGIYSITAKKIKNGLTQTSAPAITKTLAIIRAIFAIIPVFIFSDLSN